MFKSLGLPLCSLSFTTTNNERALFILIQERRKKKLSLLAFVFRTLCL